MLAFGTRIITVAGDKALIRDYNDKLNKYLVRYTDEEFIPLDSDQFIYLDLDFLDRSAFYVYEDCQNEHL